MGNQGQGAVLPGQVQGVSEGTGVVIDSEGRISFDSTTATGVVRTNNASAFNGYIWPGGTSGPDGTFLSTNATGVLAWNPPSVGSVVTMGDFAPTPERVGRLWFDSNSNLLKVFVQPGGPPGSWTPVSWGKPVDRTNVSAVPGFLSGNGSQGSPYALPSLNVTPGVTTRIPNVITVTGLAPYQYVPIIDLFGEQNGYRFSPTSYYADDSGTLTFLISFEDIPTSGPNQSYSAKFVVGFENCYISIGSDVGDALALSGPGTITSQNPSVNVGDVISYTPGTATGGVPPISYAWVWKKQSDGSVVQTDGNSLVVPANLEGDRVFVELTATDSTQATVSASTAGFPLSPALIGKNSPPGTNIAFPSSIPGEVSTLWQSAGTILSSNGCIQFKVDSGSFSQGPTPISNGQTITTKWVVSPSCGGAPNGTTISGCVFDDTSQTCATLTLDKIPSPFSFLPVSAVTPGSIVTSQIIVPMGYNTTAYVSYTGNSTATNIQASIDGGVFQNVPIFGSNTLPINPGQTLQIRATAGPNYSSPYTANINIGEGATVQSGAFTLNTSTSSSGFTTLIPFPTTTIDVPTAVSWSAGDGSTTLTSTSCIEFSVNSGAFGQGPTAITTGDTITTRWNSGGSCGGNVHGTTITGTVTDVPNGGTKTSNASLTIDRVPSSYSFTDLSNQPTNTLVTSNVLNIVGTNAPAYITYAAPPTGSSLTSVEASVGGGAWTAIPSSGTTLVINPVTAPPGVTLQIRGTTGASAGTSYGVAINIGEGTSIQQDVWTATTSLTIPTVSTPSILTPINGSTNLNPYSANPPGITITSSSYVYLNGASGVHQSTDWEIRSGSTSGTIVFNGNSTTQKTSYFLSATQMNPNTSYFVRCRYYSGDVVPVVSGWSNWSQFNTATSFSLAWVKRYVAPSGSDNNKAWGQNAVTWIGGSFNRFVFVSQNKQRSRYSSDGISWTTGAEMSSTDDFNAVAAGAGAYANTLIAVGVSSVAKKSTDGGVTWTSTGSLNTTLPMLAIACDSSGKFVAGGPLGNIRISVNGGATWSSIPSWTGGDVQQLFWDGGQFIAICSSIQNVSPVGSSNKIMTSPDGISWTSKAQSEVEGFDFKVGNITVIPGTSRYVLFPTFRNGPYQKYAQSNSLNTWNQVNSGENIGSGLAGGSYLVTGYNDYYSATTSNGPPYNFTKDFSTSNIVRCVAYSPSLNRFVIGDSDGNIASTS